MKLLRGQQKLYWKGNETSWYQPFLNSNGTFNTNTFAVYLNRSNGGNNQRAWDAFHSETYDGYYISNYGDEYRTTMFFHCCMPEPMKVTGLKGYFPRLGESSKGSMRHVKIYGSQVDGTAKYNDGAAASWSLLYTAGSVERNRYYNWTFGNDTMYKYYLIEVSSWGSSYSDEITASCLRMTATFGTKGTGTPNDYDRVELVPAYKFKKVYNKYYGFGE